MKATNEKDLWGWEADFYRSVFHDLFSEASGPHHCLRQEFSDASVCLTVCLSIINNLPWNSWTELMFQTLHYSQGCSRHWHWGQSAGADLQVSHGHSLLGIGKGTLKLSVEVRDGGRSLPTQPLVCTGQLRSCNQNCHFAVSFSWVKKKKKNQTVQLILQVNLVS